MTYPDISLKDAVRAANWAQLLDPVQMARVEADVFETFVPKGGFVCRKGEPVDNWIGVISGMVKMNNFSASGKAMTFIGVPPGSWFGEGSLLKREMRKYDTMALRDTRVARLPGATFHWLLETSLPFTRFLLMQLNERLGQFIAAREIDRLSNPNIRVARSLAALFNPVLYPGLGAVLRITQQELAYLVGLSRQRVNEALTTLAAQGAIQVEYGGLRVLNLQALRSGVF